MKPVRVTPMEGFLSFLSSGLRGPTEQITTELQDITVDTSFPSDARIWETGIKRLKQEGKWVIVEQYPDKEAATLGHQKWVKLMKKMPDFPLRDIDFWDLEEAEEK